MVTPVVRVKEWDRVEGLRHGFSTRLAGESIAYSAGHRGELNLGFTADDERERVLANRKAFLRAVGGTEGGGPEVDGATEIKTVRQVHSARIQVIRAGDVPGAVEADGMISEEAGVMLGVLAADCVPVLVADLRKRVVGAFHAGWRGTVARIVEQGIARMVEEFGARPEDMVGAVGPLIGSCCYLVGEELRERFEAEFDYGAELFSRGAYLDLAEGNRRQMIAAGLAVDRVTVVGECTSCSRIDGEKKYFSHRADHGFTGRGMGIVGFVKP